MKRGIQPSCSIVLATFVLTMVLAATLPRAAHAEAKEVRIAQQFGLQFLAVNVMMAEKLVEKHARALGLGEVAVRLVQLSAGNGPTRPSCMRGNGRRSDRGNLL